MALQKMIELGNFTKAAEFLAYTQASISQMVASPEIGTVCRLQANILLII